MQSRIGSYPSYMQHAQLWHCQLSLMKENGQDLKVPVPACSNGGVKVRWHWGSALWAHGGSPASMVAVSIATVAQQVFARKLNWRRLKLFVTVRALANFSGKNKSEWFLPVFPKQNIQQLKIPALLPYYLIRI